jgi:uncharacterized membrane protein
MNWHTISIPLIVISVLLYHLSQKTIPKDLNPLTALAAAYFVAFSLCIAALFAGGEVQKGAEMTHNQNWLPVILLGVAAVGIELGFLYAYRTGWKLSTTSITTGAFSTIFLVLIGVLWFKEELTLLNMTGIALCTMGVVFINIKQ